MITRLSDIWLPKTINRTFMRERKYVPIRWCLGNLKKTYLGDHLPLIGIQTSALIFECQYLYDLFKHRHVQTSAAEVRQPMANVWMLPLYKPRHREIAIDGLLMSMFGWMFQTLAFKPRLQVFECWCLNVQISAFKHWRQPIFEGALPTNRYDYTLPFKKGLCASMLPC